MPTYTPYREDLETIEPDEAETQARIVEVMGEGLSRTREKYGKSVRISHAKAHALLKGELIVKEGLPPELAQGLFAQAKAYPVLVRMSHAPGELTDDRKVSTPRGFALKIFEAVGIHLSPFQGITTQDWIFDTGKEFITGGAKAFLQAFKPNATLAPHLSDTTKGIVSQVTLAASRVAAAVGLGSAKLDFYGHPNKHPLGEPYFSQTPYRYGQYVAKFGLVPATPDLQALQDQALELTSYDALRDAMLQYFSTHPAEWDFVVQLNTDPEKMPIEDATVPWSEEESPFRAVARLVLPAQDAYATARKNYVEGQLSFSPAHALEVHRPLGSINRARLTAYTAMSSRRRSENGLPNTEPTSLDQIPD